MARDEKLYGLKEAPPIEDYIRGLKAIQITPYQRKLLEVQYCAPNRAATATDLAEWTGGSVGKVNANYGPLGKKLCKEIGFNLSEHFNKHLRDHFKNMKENEPKGWPILSMCYYNGQGECWVMRDELAQALESLGWTTYTAIELPSVQESYSELELFSDLEFLLVETDDIDGIELFELPNVDEESSASITNSELQIFPDQIENPETFREGAALQIVVNAYERNRKARKACINHHGVACFICGFKFGDVYGDMFKRVIHVHHLRPLSEIAGEYEVNPVEDLRPVCPNCHVVIHYGRETRTIDQVKLILRSHRDSAP
jgi:5-methylcytosine-specific restriction enzyme A